MKIVGIGGVIVGFIFVILLLSFIILALIIGKGK